MVIYYVYDLACNGWPVAALPLPRVVDVFPVAAVESMRKKKHKNPREQKRGSRALVMPAERASLGETGSSSTEGHWDRHLSAREGTHRYRRGRSGQTLLAS